MPTLPSLTKMVSRGRKKSSWQPEKDTTGKRQGRPGTKVKSCKTTKKSLVQNLVFNTLPTQRYTGND